MRNRSKHARDRKFTETKKSAQTDVYFVDPWYAKWFKVGESGLIWINSPVHELACFIFKYLRR